MKVTVTGCKCYVETCDDDAVTRLGMCEKHETDHRVCDYGTIVRRGVEFAGPNQCWVRIESDRKLCSKHGNHPPAHT